MNNTAPSVGIIMSAFNAEKYITEQIESILSQRDVKISLWIRDDGSTDNTLKILLDNYTHHPNVKITSGRNLGAAQSFFEAIFECTFNCDFYGFSDADDVWIDRKTSLSIEKILSIKSLDPVAVATKLIITDDRLNEIGRSISPNIGLIFENALIQTVTSGASIVMSKNAFNLLRSYRPKNSVMHDAWLYLLITAFGNFLYLDEPTILYRQHANNVFGTGHGFSKSWKNRIKRIKLDNPYKKQAVEFMNAFGNRLDLHKRMALEKYANYDKNLFTKINFFIYPSFKMQTLKSNVFQRFLILLGKL